MMRCFVGVRPSEEYVEFYRKNLYENPGSCLSKFFKLTSPENVHITIKFLGEVDDASKEYQDFISKLKNIKMTGQILASKNTFEFFPPNGPAKILYHGVTEEVPGSLEKLHIEVANASALLTKEKEEERGFIPHFTIGRARRNTRGVDIKDINEKDLKAFEIKFRVESFILYKSTLTPSGAKYSIIKTIR